MKNHKFIMLWKSIFSVMAALLLSAALLGCAAPSPQNAGGSDDLRILVDELSQSPAITPQTQRAFRWKS